MRTVNRSHVRGVRHQTGILVKRLQDDGFRVVAVNDYMVAKLRGVEVRMEQTMLNVDGNDSRRFGKTEAQTWVKPGWVGVVLGRVTYVDDDTYERMNVLVGKGWEWDPEIAILYVRGRIGLEEAVVASVINS